MKFLTLALILLSASLHAAITTGIAKIEAPYKGSTLHQVLAYSNGRVLEVEGHEQEILKTLKIAQESKLNVELELNENGAQITSARLIFPKSLSIRETAPVGSYEPSNISSMEKAEEMFDSLYGRTKWFTQCFNRAHIWNRQLHKDFGARSEKIFIFYTRKYRNYDRSWKWWFHVAPMVRVNGEKVVLDKEFARGPLVEYDWEEKFNEPMRNGGKRCKRISKISAYYSESNNINEYCNIQIAPMYYMEPSDLKRLESEEAVKSSWINSEIKSAAAEIFRGWSQVYEEYKVH